MNAANTDSANTAAKDGINTAGESPDRDKTELFDRDHAATVPSKGVQHMIAREQDRWDDANSDNDDNNSLYLRPIDDL